MAHALTLRLSSIQQLVERVSVTYRQALKTYALLTELRDEQTAGHCDRVAYNARVTGEALGLTKRELEALHWAGLLHDVGKIAVPEAILLKPGQLTPKEYSLMKTHAAYGADIITSISADFRPIAEGVRTHHERWEREAFRLRWMAVAIPRGWPIQRHSFLIQQ